MNVFGRCESKTLAKLSGVRVMIPCDLRGEHEVHESEVNSLELLDLRASAKLVLRWRDER